MKYTVLERFGAFSSIELMNDFDLRTLFENFKILKQDPLYSDLLEKYVFDENEKSNELCSDIITIITNGDAMIINNKELYFTLHSGLIDEIINNTPNKQIYCSFVRDYKNLLIEEEISKQK